MKKAAWIFPGQGSQAIGMGKSVFETFDEAKEIFHKASDLAGYDMYSLCTEDPDENLSRTCYTQPALFSVGAAITDVLKAQGAEPSVVAGHSLGEFIAWYAAGVYGFDDGFRLVSERGSLMDNADRDGNGKMSAVIGLDSASVREVCDTVSGTVVVANYNSPLQTVISGEKDSVMCASEILKKRGAKRVIPLKVSGAFHSPMMQHTKEEFVALLENITISDALIPVYTNVSASPVTSAEEIKMNMIEQLTSPVRWNETISTMIHDNVEEAYEIGPGTVLAGLARRTDERLRVRSISDARSIGEVMNEKA